MDKVLNKIKELIPRIEEDWEPELVEMNIWSDVCDIYFKHPEHRKANAILAMIVFAYHKESSWLDMHLDRMENKGRILKTLVGLTYAQDEDYINAAVGILSPYNQVVEWFLDYQCDRRWKDIMSGYDYHSKATSMSRMAFDAKSMTETGKMLREADERRRASDQLYADLLKENVLIDSILKKENRVPISDREKTGFTTHEIWIKGMESEKAETVKKSDDIEWDD